MQINVSKMQIQDKYTEMYLKDTDTRQFLRMYLIDTILERGKNKNLGYFYFFLSMGYI